jgi:hypothetical protein
MFGSYAEAITIIKQLKEDLLREGGNMNAEKLEGLEEAMDRITVALKHEMDSHALAHDSDIGRFTEADRVCHEAARYDSYE